MSPKTRASASNGVWLCQTCAKLVDNDPDRYTVSVLQLWKEEAEACALAELRGRVRVESTVPERQLSVALRAGALTTPLGLSDLQAIVNISNPGPRPATAASLELRTGGGVRLGIPFPDGEVTLPHRLQDGERIVLWVSAREIADALKKAGHAGKQSLTAIVEDGGGSAFESAPLRIDVDDMASKRRR